MTFLQLLLLWSEKFIGWLVPKTPYYFALIRLQIPQITKLAIGIEPCGDCAEFYTTTQTTRWCCYTLLCEV